MPKDNILSVQVVGLKPIQKDMIRDRKNLSRYKERAHKKASLAVIRQTKKEYLRKQAGFGETRSTRALRSRYHATRLGRVSGRLASSMTYKYYPYQSLSKIGWWNLIYASVVAEPPKGGSGKTVIRPKKKRLMFPLTKRARNMWHMVRPPWKWKTTKNGRSYLVIGGKRLYLYQDFTFARRVVIKARYPASRALYDLRNRIPSIMLAEYPILKPGAK
jgi:hypothetical protein